MVDVIFPFCSWPFKFYVFHFSNHFLTWKFHGAQTTIIKVVVKLRRYHIIRNIIITIEKEQTSHNSNRWSKYIFNIAFESLNSHCSHTTVKDLTVQSKSIIFKPPFHNRFLLTRELLCLYLSIRTRITIDLVYSQIPLVYVLYLLVYKSTPHFQG